MRAMILAAGRGERLRPLTDSTPKPLIEVGGQHLIDYHIFALKAAGVDRIVINVAWLGDKIKRAIGDGANYGVEIVYSDESEQALETAGGIVKALPLLGVEPFIVCNADIWTDFNFSSLALNQRFLAHLVMVKNPDHHPQGDFSISGKQLIDPDENALTYAGIGVYHPDFFAGLRVEKNALAPLIRTAIKSRQISGQYHDGIWCDIGTESRLSILRNTLRNTWNGR